MKKSVISVLAIAALMVGMISCNGAKKSNEAEKDGRSCVIAGKAPKDLLTEEVNRKLLNSWLYAGVRNSLSFVQR